MSYGEFCIGALYGLTTLTFDLLLLLLSARTPLEHCSVHNMSPFVSSSAPGSREAKVQTAKVGLNCTEPSVARSSCRAVLVGYTLQRLDGGPSEVNCEQYGRRAADASISHQVRER